MTKPCKSHSLVFASTVGAMNEIISRNVVAVYSIPQNASVFDAACNQVNGNRLDENLIWNKIYLF